jgi:glutaconyl-CoA/methylmalonyl-CoA decarboxylase subunit delta
MNFDFSNISDSALTVAIVAYCTVFFALALFALIFGRLYRVREFIRARMARKPGETEEESSPVPELTGDVNAAIGTALYLFFSELHDEEKYVMTIRKVSKTYSPWSSKIYGIWHKIS